MADIPSIFNRIDFIGILSPGYVTILLWLALFHLDYVIGTKALSYDVLSAVIFVVAGPALGVTLLRIHHALTSALRWLRHRLDNDPRKEERVRLDQKRYANVRILMSDQERVELDLPEAYTDFEASLGIALFGITIYALFVPSPVIGSNYLPFMYVISAAFFVGAWLQHQFYYVPIRDRLKEIYGDQAHS